MQHLRDSVSRASALAERMMESVHRVGPRGASDDLHVIDTLVPRVSKQVMSSDKGLTGEMQPRPGILLRRNYRAGMALAPFLIQLQWRTGVA